MESLSLGNKDEGNACPLILRNYLQDALFPLIIKVGMVPLVKFW